MTTTDISAHHVAIAIIAAARLCGVHPEQIVGAREVRPQDQMMVSRSRCYAALAIDRVFNVVPPEAKRGTHNIPRSMIARMVGAPGPSQGSLVHSIDKRLR